MRALCACWLPCVVRLAANRRYVGAQHADVRERRGHAPGPADQHVLRLRVRAQGDRQSPPLPHGACVSSSNFFSRFTALLLEARACVLSMFDAGIRCFVGTCVRALSLSPKLFTSGLPPDVCSLVEAIIHRKDVADLARRAGTREPPFWSTAAPPLSWPSLLWNA